MAYQRILAAVELNDTEAWQLAAARGVAASHSAALIALTVLEPVSQLFGGLDTIREPGFEEKMTDSALLELQEICRQRRVPVAAAAVEFGQTAPAIADYATQHGVDLIVVGAHGFHGLEYFLGTTAAGVLHAAHCDVLGVRSQRAGSYRRLLVAIDGSDGSVELLRRAARFAPDAQIEIVHVAKPLLADYDAFVAELEAELSVESLELQMHEVVRDRLNRLIAAAGVSPTGLHLPQGTPSKEIKRLAKGSGVDLVIMGCGEPAGSGWLIGSTTQNVLHGSSCDVLVIRGRD